ncbi:MAG: DUF4433 domain-containing protein [Candidatus Bathyarchaeia archaeon]|jgi:hypothetical protein
MATAGPPKPTLLYRLLHVDNLPTLLARGALHAPNSTPNDGLPYRTIHNLNVQAGRHDKPIACGPGGTCHDYVPFYFGPLSVMLLNLKTGRVQGYNEGQAPLIYLVTDVQRVKQSGCQFVFSDGHGLAAYTDWYDDLEDLDKVDWSLVGERYWADKPDDNDRQRRKQAEFLVWQSLDWALIDRIAVLNKEVKARVEGILDQFPGAHHPRVVVKSDWYYY